MLEEYKQKRKFGKTPEPSGKKTRKDNQDLIFVVQKHQARQLHYDLRLELRGVLKSWAVPKGPTLDANIKHLAQMVEDHPFDYKDFEGIIPKGNYGAGTVMVWDEGTYEAISTNNRLESEKALTEGLARGHISIVLHGKKLCGEFALVRLKKAGENSWLLIKANDECASSSFQQRRESRKNVDWEKSVKTGRTLEEIAAQTPTEGDYRGSNKLQNYSSSEAEQNREVIDLTRTINRGEKSPFPHNTKPMLATLIKEPFDDPNWIFEIKWDGYRAILEIQKAKSKKQKEINLYSRNLKNFNEKFPSIINSFKSFDRDAIFDGEIVAVDDKGRPGFQLLQDYLLNKRGNLIYYIFDILYFDGYDLRNLSLKERREILKKILPLVPNIRFSEDISEKGIEFFEVAKKENLEGIIAKKVDSTYQVGKRSKDWQKIKILMEQEAVIGGFTAPRGSRKGFGALVLGVYIGDNLEYIGHSGGGFTEQEIDFLLSKMEPLIINKSPFNLIPKTNETATWIKPELVCEVKFQEWTAEGSMRQPVFLGLREDIDPKKVYREIPKYNF